MKHISYALLAVICTLLQFPAQAQLSRLIGKANYVYSGTTPVLSDTTAYYYSGGRGGDLTHPLYFDSSITWAMGSSLIKSSRIIKTYSSTNHLQTVRESYWVPATSVWHDTLLYTFTSLDGHVCQAWNGSSWVNQYKNDFQYDGSTGDILLIIRSKYTGSTFVLDSQREISYGGAANYGQQQVDNDYCQGIFYNTNDYSFTKSNRDLFSSSIHYKWDGAAFVYCFRYNYAFDAARNNITKTHQSYNTATSNWDNEWLSVYSAFAAGHLPTNEVSQKWDSTGGGYWENKAKFDYTYNSYNQLTLRQGILWDTAGYWSMDTIQGRYYYGTYTSSLNTATINKLTDLQLYPNPASNTINLSIKWNEAQPYTIEVYDIKGRQLITRTIAATSQYKGSIPTGNLPDGNYVVRITGSEAPITKEIAIKH